MNDRLLAEFLSEDCNAHVEQKLLDSIRKSDGTLFQEYTFNRFNVTLDLVAKQVLIQDDLTAGDQGECKLGLDEFVEALRRKTKP